MLSLTRSGQKAKGRSLWLRPSCIRRSGAPSEPDQDVIGQAHGGSREPDQDVIGQAHGGSLHHS